MVHTSHFPQPAVGLIQNGFLLQVTAVRRQRSPYTVCPSSLGWAHQGAHHGAHNSAGIDRTSPQGTVCGRVNLEVQTLLQQLQADVYDIFFKLQGMKRKETPHACCVRTNMEVDSLYHSALQGSGSAE